MKNLSYIIVASLLSGAFSQMACQKSAPKNNPLVSSDSNIETVDLNNDQRIDGWNYYIANSKGERQLVQRRTDLNFDGKVDITQYFQDGALTLEEIDLDFDGRLDARNVYEKGIKVRSDMDFGFDSQPTVRRFFKDGVITRKERDTNSDGKIDAWEYFENGKLVRSGRDQNNDGVVDIWE
jgi:antitoxin component YwqK of YwqJK toxin-antitoxin module